VLANSLIFKPQQMLHPWSFAALILLVWLAIASQKCSAQALDSIRIEGLITNESGGEALSGATVFELGSSLGTSANLEGRYELVVPVSDSLQLRVSYVGFENRTVTQLIEASDSQSGSMEFDVALSSGVALSEVTVSAEALRERLRSVRMGLERIDARQAKLIPALLGEVDVLRAVQLKPGIPSGSEGATGLFVRGGGGDQNLFLLDGATVYNPNHLFGFFSTFNADAVAGLDLYKAGFPARYGGRLSGIIDVTTRPASAKTTGVRAGVGLLASRLTVEGPLGKSKRAGYMLNARRTYVDLITDQVNRIREGQPDVDPIPGYNFYDLNAKVGFDVSSRDRVEVSGYFGRDRFRFDNEDFEFRFNWGNATLAAQWQHLSSDRLSITTAATLSDYQYAVTNSIPGFNFEVGSEVRDIGLRSDALYAVPDGQSIRFGASLTHHQFGIGRLRAGSTDGEISFSAGEALDAVSWGTYLSDEVALGPKGAVELGLRVSGFSNDGTNYARLEPRIATSYALAERVNVKASFARMYQYIHLVSSAGVALPTDIWYPSTQRVKPQRSDQTAIGLSFLPVDGVLISAESYYKDLRQQVDFVDGAELFVNNDLAGDFDFGRGHAYGVELQVERTVGKLKGWIGYTWQRTRRGGFPNIMQGRYFSPRFDRRHDLSVVGFYELNDRWTLTATWVYGSGDLYWLPVGRKLEQGAPGSDLRTIIPVYGDRNNYRLRSFHRGDIGAVMKLYPSWAESSDLTFSIFNVYDRRNAFFVYIDIESEEVPDADGGTIDIPSKLTPKQVSLFPVLPSVTWNFSF